MKEIPVGKCIETEDKFNSVIRTKRVDQACWDMQCGNRIPSQRHILIQGFTLIHLQCLHTLARSSCTEVCMLISNQF